MTAVKGPFLFTSDRWSDDFITKAKQAGCGAIALQLGVALEGTASRVRAAGLQVIGWGACEPSTMGDLDAMNPQVWMPQAENTDEFKALVNALQLHPFTGSIEPVMTSGGM